MPQKNRKNLQKSKERLSNYAKYSGIAFQMTAIILLGVLGGKKLDNWLELKKPVFTAVLSLIAVILAIYYAIKDLIKTK
jgi:hypothetical protein